jgi:nicotinate-nucleotide adenylyltransferase
MKIAILGGSFNPPHLGHLLVARQVKETLRMDEVWLMPCNKHPFSKKIIAAQDRLQMTKLVEEKGIKASDFEVKKNQISYTVDTIRTLIEKLPQHRFYWIIGSEQLSTFYKWKQPQKLLHNHRLIVFPRNINGGLEDLVKKNLCLKTIPKKITLLESKKLITTNLSSSLIRERLKKGLSIKYLVPEKIRQYIIKNKLYED